MLAALANTMDSKSYYLDIIEKQFSFFKSGMIENRLPFFANTLEVELASFCNLDCPFCPTGSLQRERSLLPLEDFKKLIDYLVKKKLRPRISFSGDGEMFIHKEIIKFVEYAKRNRFHVQIINNATLCTPQKSRELIALGLDRIQFSLDSVLPESYARSRRAKNSKYNHNYYYKAIGNVMEYARLNYEAGSPTTISVMSVQTQANRREAEIFQRFWERFPIHNIYLSPLYTLAGNAARKFGEAAAEEFRGDSKSKPVCDQPFTQLAVKSDGRLLCCCHDSEAVYPIGNFIENGQQYDAAPCGERIERSIEIDRLWNGERARRLREALLRGELESLQKIGHDCQRCNVPLHDGGLAGFDGEAGRLKYERIYDSMKSRRQPAADERVKYENLLAALAENRIA